MKRKIQNLFRPFTVNSNLVKNGFLSGRKISLASFSSNTNWPLKGKNVNNESLTHNSHTEYLFSAFDLNLKKPGFKNETQSNPRFIYNTEKADNINFSGPVPQFNTEYPIIATHWGEFNDYELLNGLISEETKKSNPFDTKQHFNEPVFIA